MESMTSVLAGLLFGGLLQAACSSESMIRQPEPMPAVVPLAEQPGDRLVLAGEWEYQDGSAAYALKFDQQGNGTYAWKDGWFETSSLSDHRWSGMWFQRENDREGGSEVIRSPDYSEGEGRWWYTRIGTNTTPTEKGGTFHLSKKASSTRRDVIAPTP